MAFNLSKGGISLLNDINVGINRLLGDVNATYGADKVSSCVDGLYSCILSSCEEDTEVSRGYCKFLAKTSLLAYLQKFDNDKNLNNLKGDSDEFEIDDFLGEGNSNNSDLGTDFKFGFQGLYEFICTSVELLNNSESDEDTVSGKVTSNLLANIRDISSDEYFSGNYMDMDIRLIALLGEEEPANTFEEIIEFIKTDNKYASLYTSLVDNIMGVYKYLLQDSFGLRPYVGVLSIKNGKCKVVTSANKLSDLKGAGGVFAAVSMELSVHYKVDERGDRQFNLKDIINSNSSVSLYFPYKLLEYAMGRCLTYHLSERVYKEYEKTDSWESYADGYVKPQIVRYMLEAIYFSMEKHFDFSSIGVAGKSFTSDDFKSIWNDKKGIIIEMFGSINMTQLVISDLQRVQASLCTGCVVVGYNNLGGKVNSIKLRVVDINNNLDASITGDLFRGCTLNQSIKYSDGEKITDGRFLFDGSTPLPYGIYEYSHDFDSAVSNAEPLFGYKAVEMFAKRGVAISWNRILLGEDTKGTPIFASLIDKDDFPMQANAVHNMMAGSRSGKGVLTMNLIAGALANGKPVFYIDRKPDMSVMFYELSRGNMFCINGGQYLSKNDMRGTWSEGGTALQGWQSAYQAMPSYLKDDIFTNPSYYGNFGDMVYYRACMFVLSILVARVELMGNSDIYSNLGGESGILIVIDEFRNWQEDFESSFFSATGVFGNTNRLSKKDEEDYAKLSAEIKGLEAQMENADEIKRIKFESNLSLKLDSRNKKVTPTKVYATTVMNKYGETVKNISEVLAAGFKDSEGRLSDIFVIGQHIEIDGYNGASNESGTYEQRDSGLFSDNERTKNKSLMRGVLNMFAHDWFMGRNINYPSYMGASEGSRSSKWLNDLSYWGYCKGEMETLRKAEPSNVRYFKPYLVLNKNCEDDPNDRKMIDGNIPDPDYAFVALCRSRVNEAVPGANLWEKVRLKYLASPDNTNYGNLHRGIGFEGLAEMTASTNGGNLSSVFEALSKSMNIANYVAQCMGYSDYKSLLFDFSPQGVFSSRDVVQALKNPSSYQNISKRLPLFAKYGLLSVGEEERVYGGSFSLEDGEIIGESEEYFDDDIIPTGVNNVENSNDDNDGWFSVDDDIEDEEDSLSDDVIRDVCNTVLAKQSARYGIVLSQGEINTFCNKIISAVKGVDA